MSSAVSKDKMTAYERWEMTSFDADHSQNSHATPKQNEQEKLQDQVQQEGYNAGYKEGYKEGYEQAYEEGQKAGNEEMQSKLQKGVQESISAIEQLAQHFTNELAKTHQDIGNDFINLAIDLAQAMTKAHFDLHPEAINDIVTEAVNLVPQIHQPAYILLHPLDAKIVEENLAQQLKPDGWKIIADQHIERGGCKIETAHNIIDATTPTRWARLTTILQKQKTHPINQDNQVNQNNQNNTTETPN